MTQSISNILRKKRKSLHFSTTSRVVKTSKKEIIDLALVENKPKVPESSGMLDYKKDLDQLINTVSKEDIEEAQLELTGCLPSAEEDYKNTLKRFAKQQQWKSTSTCIIFIVLIASIITGAVIKIKFYGAK